MNVLKLRVNQVKNLISIAEERNLSVPFTSEDIDELLSEDTDELSKLRALGRYASIIHEVLYAPPHR